MTYTASKDEILNYTLDNDDEIIKIKIINFDDKYYMIKTNNCKFFTKKESINEII